MVSIVDIARRAGVGKSTAARVLSGQGPVSAAARKRVLAAADAAKYRANAAARSLRRGENRLLGIVIPDANSRGALSHAISAQKVEGVALAAKRLGYDLQIFIEDLTDVEALRRLAMQKDVRGFLFLGPVGSGVLELLKRYRIHWIGINWQLPGRPEDPCCMTDFAHAGRTLCNHLVAVGCRRVLAFDWLTPSYPAYAPAMLEAWAAARLPRRQLLLHSGPEYAKGAALEASLSAALDSKAPPDGLLLGLDEAAAAAYRLLRARGLVPGKDLALATFDDLHGAFYQDPPCTAYRQPALALGEAAVGELDRVLHARAGAGSPTALRLAGELQVRPSSAHFRARSN